MGLGYRRWKEESWENMMRYSIQKNVFPSLQKWARNSRNLLDGQFEIELCLRNFGKVAGGWLWQESSMGFEDS